MQSKKDELSFIILYAFFENINFICRVKLKRNALIRITQTNGAIVKFDTIQKEKIRLLSVFKVTAL